MAALCMVLPMLFACSHAKSSNAAAIADSSVAEPVASLASFNADSAYSYTARQVEFGPRIHGTTAHTATGDWIADKMRGFGLDVKQQRMTLHSFDGVKLDARNIFASLNPNEPERILLLAHWDTRPWADEDPDPAKHSIPVDGANDGASGVAVLIEIARQLALGNSDLGIDFLFVDAEDRGREGDDESWAMGAEYFVNNPVVKDYRPKFAILLDMVGGDGAVFCREYFSQKAAPALADNIWAAAREAGFQQFFPNVMGGAVTDDHVKFIAAGIPAVDIIEYHPEYGFNRRWHTTSDNMEGISRSTLDAVGNTIIRFLNKQ